MTKRLSTAHRKIAHRQRGVALLVVLGSLVFVAALAIAFLASAGSDLKSSKVYAEGSTVRIMSQSAVNMVMGEIAEGTRGYESGDAAKKPLAWASQPGMIRTYDATGQPTRYYRLYSSDVMTGVGVYDDTAAGAAVPATWAADKALFTDLNQPVRVDNVDHYPIIDGNKLVTLGGVQTYDADGDGTPDVQGFSIANAPVAAAAGANPAPMPVRWLYVLAKGQIVAGTGGGSAAQVAGATSDNPIVGRIAFWTDDETSKININTASEGVYWDSPRTSSKQDTNFGRYQPAQHEYQRYAGHPATTSLSQVFNQLTAEQIYQIVPRIVGGSGTSLGGTVAANAVVTPDSDRLYATVDELLFKPGITGANRDRNDAAVLNKDTLEKTKFFITAASRAPDVNLFNLPRVCIWPVHLTNDATHRTPFDQLIAFCSTVNTHPFFFVRSDPLSPTTDLPGLAAATGLGRNRGLLEYLRRITSQPIPGFGGGTFELKYGAKDRDQLLTGMFDYVRSTNLLDVSTSGVLPFTPYAKGAANPFAPGSGQVVPIEDPSTGTRGFGRFPTLKGVSLLFVGVSDTAAVTPPQPPPPSANQIVVQAVIIPQLFDPSFGYPGIFPSFTLRIKGLKSLKWTGVNAAGAPAAESDLFTLDSYEKKVGTGSTTTVKIWGDNGYGGSWGAMEVPGGDFSYPFVSVPVNMLHPAPPPSGTPLATPPTFPFAEGKITLEFCDPANSSIVFQSIELRLPAGNFPVPKVAPAAIQTAGAFTYDFRKLGPGGGTIVARFGARNDNKQAAWVRVEDVVRSVVPADGDLRMVMPRKTILASDAEYPTFFAAHSKYASAENWAHNLRNGQNSPYYKSTGGRLLATASYDAYQPQYSSGATDMNTGFPVDSSVVPDTFTGGVALGKTTTRASGDLPGDWDNGLSYFPDGPYINKADEGDYTTVSSGNPTVPYFATGYNPIAPSLFSPNRMMPSPGMFGSLPTGVWRNQPWQTLLFRPGPDKHPGLLQPKDHLWLDLFQMPVVEPYALSEPLSTAGRINMNYRIVPFTYITRTTALRAVLKSEAIVAIPTARANVYKRTQRFDTTTVNFRVGIDVDETLKAFTNRFEVDKDLFRSASEICDVHLVPQGATLASMDAYWNDKELTGDNARERPYTTIYPRLTTKSNTYTVHLRVQTLKKATGGVDDVWRENQDLITGEYRGSQLLERYIDPNDIRVPDAAEATGALGLGDYYKFRVVTSKQFAP